MQQKPVRPSTKLADWLQEHGVDISVDQRARRRLGLSSVQLTLCCQLINRLDGPIPPGPAGALILGQIANDAVPITQELPADWALALRDRFAARHATWASAVAVEDDLAEQECKRRSFTPVFRAHYLYSVCLTCSSCYPPAVSF